MQLHSHSFADNSPIPGEFAFGIIDPANHVALSHNRNPHLAWTDIPTGARSFVVICHDPDVPSCGDAVNQEGRVVPASLPRVDFFHWLLINLPATVNEISAGEFSSTISVRGKSGPSAHHGSLQGINNYTDWFAGDKDMNGDYYGYDGPCPPWNDAILHHYIFTVYALDVEKLPLTGKFGGPEVRTAITPHILAEARLTGTYTLNPQLL